MYKSRTNCRFFQMKRGKGVDGWGWEGEGVVSFD